jgi:hypothetical protein
MEEELLAKYYAAGSGKKFEKIGDKIISDKRTCDDVGKLIQL